MSRRLFSRLAIATLLTVSLSGCGALEDALAAILNDYAFGGISESVMGDDETISSTISLTDEDSFEGLSDELRAHYDIVGDAQVEVVALEPVLTLEESAEQLFTDEDRALLASFDPSATDATIATATRDRGSVYVKFWTYYHVANQGADFEFPLRRRLVGGWTLDRIVVDNVNMHSHVDYDPRAREFAPFQVDMDYRIYVDLLDGTGSITPRDSQQGWPPTSFDQALESSSDRGFAPLSPTSSQWSVPHTALCAGSRTNARCILRPNTATGSVTVQLALRDRQLAKIEDILRGGQNPNGLMLFIRSGSDPNDLDATPNSGVPFDISRRDSTVRYDWRIEDFSYDTN